MKRNIINDARDVLKKIAYLTLATVDEQSRPWNAPVYCAFNDSYTFYWVSWVENQHSQNIIQNGKVFAVVYDSAVAEGTGFGVYLQGTARVLDKKDL